MFGNKNSKEDLVNELASILDGIGSESNLFIDLTAQNIGFDIADPFAVDPDFERQLDGHEIVYIDTVSSCEGFEIMRDFAEGCGGRQREILIGALSKRHPFRMFKNAVMRQGMLDEWYAFKNNAYKESAQLRLDDSEVDFIEGKIVCGNKDNITNYHYEALDDDFCDEE